MSRNKNNNKIKSNNIERAVDFVFNKPFFYEYLRGLILFGFKTGPIRDFLDAQPYEKIIDVGCGTGYHSRLVKNPNQYYVGIDTNIDYINQARRKYGKENTKFIIMDATKIQFEKKSFDKALYLGVLHHLSDNENLRVFDKISQITKDSIVITDLAWSRYHFLNNFLIKHDRGKYFRNINQQVKLIEQYLNIQTVSYFWARSGIAKYSLILAKPK